MKGLGWQPSSVFRIALLLALCLILYLPPIISVPFFDKGEPREALEVQYIVTQGQWLFPLKGEGEIPSKPPLFHWTGALFSLIWGETTEATVRFPSVFYATLGVLLVYLFGCRLFDPRVAFLAGVILATTFIYEKQAVEARVDMTLTFFVTASLIVFYFLYRGWIAMRSAFYGFYFLLGIGVLAKGPVGLILPALTIAIFLALRKRWDFLSKLCLHPGVVLALGIGLSWYSAAILQGGEEFVGRQIVKENLARFFVYGEGGTGHQKPIYYYGSYLFLLGLPWSLLLPFMMIHWVKHGSLKEESFLFLGIWIAVVFGFLSLSAGKRAVYILPLYPPLAVLTAQWLQADKKFSAIEKLGLRAVGVLCFVVAVTLAALVFWNVYGSRLADFISSFEARNRQDELKLIVNTVLHDRRWAFRGFVGVGAFLWFLTGWKFFKLRLRGVPLQLSLVSIASWLCVQTVFVPPLAHARSYARFMKEVKGVTAQGGELFIYGESFDSSSIAFYHGAQLPVLEDNPAALLHKLGSGRVHVIMKEKEWEEIQTVSAQLDLIVIKSRGTGPESDTPLVLVFR
jgi:4-amino-4-deoxy-L-arabinose transferase-like glycosyltransferase